MTFGGAMTVSKESEDQLIKNLGEALSGIELVPDDTIVAIHSAGYAEDGKTFILMLDTAEGGTLIVSACPGEALRVSLA